MRARRFIPRFVSGVCLALSIAQATTAYAQDTSAPLRDGIPTPEQYIAGLTDFGPGRSKLFGNSADEYLKVHHLGRTDADVTEVIS